MATTKLNLPYLAANQANKEITHNEALAILDAMAQTSAITAGDDTPPSTPSDGDTYIVGASATGAWSGQDDNLAIYFEAAGTWRFLTPQENWTVYVETPGIVYVFTSGAWVPRAGFAASTAEDGITASTTQTQVGATELAAQCSRITTCANTGDSVRIGVAALPGLFIEILNSGANDAWVWPSTGDAIDAAAADARDASALTAGTVRRYRCFTAGTWRTV